MPLHPEHVSIFGKCDRKSPQQAHWLVRATNEKNSSCVLSGNSFLPSISILILNCSLKSPVLNFPFELSSIILHSRPAGTKWSCNIFPARLLSASMAGGLLCNTLRVYTFGCACIHQRLIASVKPCWPVRVCSCRLYYYFLRIVPHGPCTLHMPRLRRRANSAM